MPSLCHNSRKRSRPCSPSALSRRTWSRTLSHSSSWVTAARVGASPASEAALLKFWLGSRPVRQIHEGILDGSLQPSKLPGQLRVSAEQAATEQPGSQARKVLLRQRDTLPLQPSHTPAGRKPGRGAQQGKSADEADNQGDSTLPTKIKGVLQQHNPCQTKRAQASYHQDSHPEGHSLRVTRGSARERPLPRVQPGLIGVVTVVGGAGFLPQVVQQRPHRSEPARPGARVRAGCRPARCTYRPRSAPPPGLPPSVSP